MASTEKNRMQEIGHDIVISSVGLPHCIALHCIALHCIVMYCFCIALHCILTGKKCSHFEFSKPFVESMFSIFWKTKFRIRSFTCVGPSIEARCCFEVLIEHMHWLEHDLEFFLALGCAIVLHCIALPFDGTAGWHVIWRASEDSVYNERYRATAANPPKFLTKTIKKQSRTLAF